MALILVVLPIVAVAWLLIVYPDAEGPGTGNRVTLRMDAETSSLSGIASRLEREGVLEHPSLFSVYLRILGADEKLRDGTVVVHDAMTPGELVRHLAVGFGRIDVRVTIPEGFSRFDVARRLEEHGVCDARSFLSATENPRIVSSYGIEADDLEGYLYPDTYEMREDEDPRRVIRRLMRNFDNRVGDLLEQDTEGYSALREGLGWDLHEVLIMASIVEKEAVASAERPTIAGVFLNRLTSAQFRPRRLQADPTVSYGCARRPGISRPCHEYDGRRITRAMLSDRDNPYNTYRHEGLPPGPICNPGSGAIRAVLAPERHEYYYFVARGSGRHHFSSTLAEHNRAVQRYLR